MDIVKWLYVAGAVIVFLTGTLIPAIITAVKAFKKLKNAKTETEKLAAKNELTELLNEFIKEAESKFNSFNSLYALDKDKSLGTMKKESVMTKLRQQAINNGYAFDEEYWSNKVDEVVAFTQEVNVKQ